MTTLWCADFSPIRAISKAVLGLNIYLIAITEAAGSQSERDSLLCDLAWGFSAHGYILSACPAGVLRLTSFFWTLGSLQIKPSKMSRSFLIRDILKIDERENKGKWALGVGMGMKWFFARAMK